MALSACSLNNEVSNDFSAARGEVDSLFVEAGLDKIDNWTYFEECLTSHNWQGNYEAHGSQEIRSLTERQALRNLTRDDEPIEPSPDSQADWTVDKGSWNMIVFEDTDPDDNRVMIHVRIQVPSLGEIPAGLPEPESEPDDVQYCP